MAQTRDKKGKSAGTATGHVRNSGAAAISHFSRRPRTPFAGRLLSTPGTRYEQRVPPSRAQENTTLSPESCDGAASLQGSGQGLPCKAILCLRPLRVLLQSAPLVSPPGDRRGRNPLRRTEASAFPRRSGKAKRISCAGELLPPEGARQDSIKEVHCGCYRFTPGNRRNP